MREKSSSIGRY
uniref:Uncharacterized protein n=1 Tax=Rhizophora mucronata TaxID=61149 RepID=A0A2P2QSK0_RHIMU